MERAKDLLLSLRLIGNLNSFLLIVLVTGSVLYLWLAACFSFFLSFFFFLFKFIYLFSRGRGAERGGDRILSRLCAVSAEPNTGLKPTNCEITT